MLSYAYISPRVNNLKGWLQWGKYLIFVAFEQRKAKAIITWKDGCGEKLNARVEKKIYLRCLDQRKVKAIITWKDGGCGEEIFARGKTISSSWPLNNAKPKPRIMKDVLKIHLSLAWDKERIFSPLGLWEKSNLRSPNTRFRVNYG